MPVCGLSLHLGSSESRKIPEQEFIFQIGTLNPSTNLFLFSCHHIPTNSVAPLFAYKPTHNPKFLQSLWRKAYARNVSFFTLYGGQLTFSTQLLTLNYLLYSTTDAAPQFLKKLTPFTKSWFQILITLKSMRCSGASLQLIMVGSKSYVPTGIFAKARFHIFNRNSISIVISGDGISIKILSIPQVSKKVQRDAIYRKMESSKLSQSKRNLKLTSIAKSANSNLLLPTSPPPPSHFENILLVRNIEIKIKQMLSFIYQNSVPNLNCPLVHAIGCIENEIKLWYMQMS